MLSFYHLIISSGKPYSIWRHDRSVINNDTIPATLSMSTGDWIPLIEQQYLTITWNYASGTILQPGASQTVTITFNVNQYVIGVNTFTNTVYVIATQSS